MTYDHLSWQFGQLQDTNNIQQTTRSYDFDNVASSLSAIIAIHACKENQQDNGCLSTVILIFFYSNRHTEFKTVQVCNLQSTGFSLHSVFCALKSNTVAAMQIMQDLTVNTSNAPMQTHTVEIVCFSKSEHKTNVKHVSWPSFGLCLFLKTVIFSLHI